jgi:hypothetical protein
MTKTVCDCCGEKLTTKNSYENTNIEVGHYLWQIDLCEKCFENLADEVSGLIIKYQKTFIEERSENGKQTL